MKRFLTGLLTATGLAFGGVAAARDGHPDRSHDRPPTVVVNNVGNGTGNTVEVDPKAGQKVVVKNSGNGTGNTVVIGPDPGGTVVVKASGNGTGDKIIIEKAPGEKVKIEGSGHGKNSNVVVVNVPGPTPARPPAPHPPARSGGQRQGRR